MNMPGIYFAPRFGYKFQMSFRTPPAGESLRLWPISEQRPVRRLDFCDIFENFARQISEPALYYTQGMMRPDILPQLTTFQPEEFPWIYTIPS